MGGLFSSASSADEQQYQMSIQQLREEQKRLETEALKAERVREQTLEQQYKRQKEIALQRIAEIKETIRRAQELRDARRALNIQASVLLCAIYFNYPFGTIEGSALDSPPSGVVDSGWQDNATDIVNVAVNNDVFWLLCKIPQLLPLLWPTGRTEDAFHQYKSRDDTGTANAADYLLEVKANLPAYINGPLKTYITNVFQANCSRDLVVDTDNQDALYEACAAFINTMQNVSNDDEWILRAYAFIKNDDKMRWKGFAAKSGKGVCATTIELLPSTYPKICPKYELYESLLMLSNTVINMYGQCKTSTGNDVKATRKVTGTRKVKKFYYELTDEQKVNVGEHGNDDVIEIEEEVIEVVATKPDTNGGQCFAIKNKWKENAYKAAIDNVSVWDGATFVKVKDVVVNEDVITGEKDTKTWMEDTEVSDELEIYYLNNGDRASQSNGYVRYKNPTREFTHQFLNDVDGIVIPFQMPRLSANINTQFRRSFLYNAFTTLTTVADNEQYDLYRTNNKYIFTSIDYMTVRPPSLDEWEIEGNVMPIPRFIYTCLIEYSCKWDLTIPLNSSMSMSQINGAILNEFNDKSMLPQYLWTRTENVKDRVQGNGGGLGKAATVGQMNSSSVFTSDKVVVV